MKHISIALTIISLILSPLGGGFLSAANYDAGLIISDEELFAPKVMTVDQVQLFLEGHSGILKDYFTVDVDGHLKTASMIIHDAAERNKISVAVLLVLLQKEQGLITNADPYTSQLDWATGYAVCDSCDVEHPLVVKYKGFSKQVDSAAWRLRYYTENIDDFHFSPGKSFNIDGTTVFVKNMATAALYNYTPHLHGNKIFFKLWNSWFGGSISYPNGTLLQAFGEPGVWLIRDGVRHPFKNIASLTSRYRIDQIVQVPKTVLDRYPTGPVIAFPEFSLLQTPEGKRYLLANNELRWIVDDATFRQLGFFPDEVVAVSLPEISFFGEGQPITIASLDPLGALVQDPESYGIYYVKDGIKYPLTAPELLSMNFPNMRVRKGSTDELIRYAKGAPVLLKDGFLVKSSDSPAVYVIAKGQKHEIDSEYTFNSLGYNWNNIHTVSAGLLAIHPAGEALSVQAELTDEEVEHLVSSE